MTDTITFENLHNLEAMLNFNPFMITIEDIKRELKEEIGKSFLAIDDTKGGLISLENLKIERNFKSVKAGTKTETIVVVLSDTPGIGSPKIMTVENLLEKIKRYHDDWEVMLDNLNGNWIPVEAIRHQKTVGFPGPGLHSEVALVVLSQNPWSDADFPAAATSG